MKKRLVIPGCLFALCLIALSVDYQCATVSISIRQELTLERQAFEAEMTINNGFDGVAPII